ncbi:hypothetical protein KCU83_g1542, partial [Aureobasidium melanogenum]
MSCNTSDEDLVYLGPPTPCSAKPNPSQSAPAKPLPPDSATDLLCPLTTDSISSGLPSEDTVNLTPSGTDRRTYAKCLKIITNDVLLIFSGKLKLVDRQLLVAKSALLAD